MRGDEEARCGGDDDGLLWLGHEVRRRGHCCTSIHSQYGAQGMADECYTCIQYMCYMYVQCNTCAMYMYSTLHVYCIHRNFRCVEIFMGPLNHEN